MSGGDLILEPFYIIMQLIGSPPGGPTPHSVLTQVVPADTSRTSRAALLALPHSKKVTSQEAHNLMGAGEVQEREEVWPE